MPSTKGSMAPSIIYNDAIQGETFLPGQIFLFGGFVLWANLLGHLEQIDSYAPGHQVRFGSMNYVADIRGDLIFNGFETAVIAPPHSDEHDLNLSPDHIQRMVPAAATSLELEQIESYVLLAATMRRVRHGLESVEDQVSVNIGRVVQVSKSYLMARGVAVDLL